MGSAGGLPEGPVRDCVGNAARSHPLRPAGAGRWGGGTQRESVLESEPMIRGESGRLSCCVGLVSGA